MKLQKLTIHNIASIEDAIIDFEKEPLAGSDVFLITGDTGSGKSTILDAICLALYANTPRLKGTQMDGKLKDGNIDVTLKDPRQLMRRNAGECFVELTFTTFKDNKNVHYKAKWELHRAFDKPDGRLHNKIWTLENEDTGYKFTGDKEIVPEITKAVGLTFEQFCRTTLLAQGEFTRFLNSSDDEKAGILEKITGTGIYKKIGSKIYDVTAKKKILFERAKEAIGQTETELLSDEKIDEKKKKMADCGTQYEALMAERDNASKKHRWLTKEKELKDAFALAEQECNKAKQAVETDEFKAKDLLVIQWNTTIEARGWLTAHKKAEDEKAQQSGKLEGLKADYLKILAGYAFEEQKRQQTEQKRNDLPQVDEKEGENAQDTLKELIQQRDSAKELRRNIETAEGRIKDLNEKKQLRQQAFQSLKDTQEKAKEKEQAAEALKQPIADALQKKNDREEAFNTQKEVNDVLIQLIRQKVHVGDTCPVCHQPIKENLPHEEQLTQLINDSQELFKEAKKAYDGLVEKRNKLLAEKKAYDDSYARAQAAFEKDTSVADALQRVNEACSACGIETFDETTTPQQMQTLKEKTDAEIEQLNEKIPSLNEKVNAYINTTKERSLLNQQLEKINLTLASVQQAVDAIRKDRPEWMDLKPTAAAEMEKLSTEANEVRVNVNAAVTQFSKASEAADDNQSRLNQFLADHPDMTRERLTVLNGYTLKSISDESEYLVGVRTRLSNQKILRDKYDKEWRGHQQLKPEMAEEDTLEKLASLVTDKEKEMGEVNTEKGRIQNELQTDDRNREKYGELLKKKELLEADYNKWHRFNDFLGDKEGKNFNGIAQSYILGSLIHSANHYMQNLYDRYTLKVVPGTFIIMIEDAYQGYASRAVSTISGGESFLVSLALALALSDIGDQLAVDTLFIDEGFGTLSGAPLQHAIDTLRKLHTQSGRHVGIISHIEELRESITTQIQVSQSPQTGSSYIDIIPQ